MHSQIWNSIEMPLNLCWDLACLPKAGFFLWLALQNKALTADRLSRLGIIGPKWCVMCKRHSEDVDHLFLNFPVAQKCWDWFKNRLNWSSPFQNSLKGLLSSWPTNLVRGVYRKLWNICPSIVIWELWKERNHRIFKDKERNIDKILLKLEVAIIEVMNAHLRKPSYEEGSFSSWDGTMKKKWSNLINPPLVYATSNREARAKCKWVPPPPGWHKLNFDGVARGNLGIASLGCIINDEDGRWVAKLASPLPSTSNNMEELEALERGVQLFHRLGLSKIFIEGDSQVILNVIRKKRCLIGK